MHIAHPTKYLFFRFCAERGSYWFFFFNVQLYHPIYSTLPKIKFVADRGSFQFNENIKQIYTYNIESQLLIIQIIKAIGG